MKCGFYLIKTGYFNTKIELWPLKRMEWVSRYIEKFVKDMDMNRLGCWWK